MAMRTGIFLALLACSPLLAATAQAGNAPDRQVHTYAVDIGSDGHVSQARLHSGSEDGAAQIAEQLRQWRFSPMHEGGQVVAGTTYVRVVSERGSDGVEVVAVNTGAAPDQLTMPAYPRSAEREGLEGVVVLELAIGADGRVTGREVRGTNGQINRAMAQAALQAAEGWRFLPETVAGNPVSGRMLFPVCFYATTHASQACQWTGPDNAAMDGLELLSLESATRVADAVAQGD